MGEVILDIQVDPNCNYTYPYKREADRDLNTHTEGIALMKQTREI